MIARAVWMVAALALSLTLATPRTAAADPLALRHGQPERGVIVEGGWPSVSAGVWLKPRLGLALDWRLPAAAAGLSIGTRRTLADGPRHGGVDLFVAGGVLVPFIEPGVALTATPAIQAGHRGGIAHVTIGLAAPIEARLAPEPQLRLPLLLELRLGFNLGPLWLGLRGGLGAALNTGGAGTILAHWSVWVRVPVADPIGPR